MKFVKNSLDKIPATVLGVICLIIIPGVSHAYHPLSTDEPSTTEYRHFELEWASDLGLPEGKTNELDGYLAAKCGLLTGLEFDAIVNFIYWGQEKRESPA